MPRNLPGTACRSHGDEMEQYWDQQQWASGEEHGRPPPRKLASRDSGNIMRSLLKQDQTEEEQSCKTSRRGQGVSSTFVPAL